MPVPILALTLAFTAFAHADDAADVDADAVKAALLDQINVAISKCEQRAERKDRCCKGSAKDCAGVDKRTTVAMLSATARIKASASAEDSLGALGAAEHMGELTDNVKQAGDAMVGACNSLADSCKQTCDADYESFKAACPECEADMQNLRIAAGNCKANYAGPANPKPPVTRVNGDGSSPPSMHNPSIPSSAILVGGAQPVPPTLNRDQRQYMATEEGTDSPYKIDNDNSEWRRSLNSTKGDSEAQTAELMKSFARAAAESTESPPRGITAQSATMNGSVGGATAAVAPAVIPPVRMAQQGTVGMREGAVHRTAGTSSSASMQTVTNGSPKPVAHIGNPALGRGAVGFAAPGSFARDPSSGSGFAASDPPRGGFGDANSGSLYKSQDAGVAGGGGGGGGSRMNPQSAQQPQLADYLPNGRLGPNGAAIAGGNATANPQILSRGKDVWQNMSMRLQYFCKIGHLYDCK